MRFVIVLFLASLMFPASASPCQKTSPGEGPLPTSRILPAYPAIAVARKVSGAVLIYVTVSAEGKVIEASVISGPELLQSPAKKAALLWRFELLKGAGAARSVLLTFIFHDPSYMPPEKAPDFTCPYQIEVEWTAEVGSFKN